MVVRQDFHGFDGKPMANISSLGECQDYCLSRSDCHSIDYVVAAEAKAPFCFWFDDKYVNVYEARGVNHYTRKDCIREYIAMLYWMSTLKSLSIQHNY